MRFTVVNDPERVLQMVEGEWVFTGDKMDTVSAQLTQVAVEWVPAAASAYPYPVTSVCGAVPEATYLMPVLEILAIQYLDDEAGGEVVPTIPGPPKDCCNDVSEGLDADCATETTVTIL